MPFCSFSKDFTENLFTSVENQFITKYLPEASGDAVRVYLYGLYLCESAKELDAASCAKLLKLTEDQLLEIFDFWEECGLVQILSRSPLYIEYLPVHSAVGKPKPIRPEKYAEFNRALFRLLQEEQIELTLTAQRRFIEFLEAFPMEPQAFLLIVGYYAKKDAARFSYNRIVNKAKQLAADGKLTYEQVEAQFSDFNEHAEELSHIFTLMGIFRKAQDADYALLSKWRNAGMETGAVYAAAEALKKGTLSTLDGLITELIEGEAKTTAEAKAYLARREELSSIVYKVAKKLGVKVENPRPYMEEYAEKWLERGYDSVNLTLVAALCMRLSYGFAEMDTLLDTLYAGGIVDEVSVKEYCNVRENQLKLIQKLQSVCGVVKKTQAALDMVAAWRSWNFSDEMILEAAKRSAGAQAPLSYINKLLSEWKRLGVTAPSEIPEREQKREYSAYKSEAAIAADARADREHYYALRRERAGRRVERAKALAERDEEFREAEATLKRGELELARAEVYAPETLPALNEKLEAARKMRAEALKRLNLSERDFVPKYVCEKCSDTGFLPDGRACDCYPEG